MLNVIDMTNAIQASPTMIQTARLAAAAGLSHERIAKLHGITERTLYRMKHREPELASALNEGARVNARRCRCCGQNLPKHGENENGKIGI